MQWMVSSKDKVRSTSNVCLPRQDTRQYGLPACLRAQWDKEVCPTLTTIYIFKVNFHARVKVAKDREKIYNVHFFVSTICHRGFPVLRELLHF